MPTFAGAVPTYWAVVDQEGRLVFPADLTRRYGLSPGAEVRIDEETNGLRLHRPVTSLAKIYVEPTNLCNLKCRTCVRNAWEESLGRMTEEIFTRIIEDVKNLLHPPTIFFGGLGEPLFHPQIVEMVARAKNTGCRVEMITNGTLLEPPISTGLVKAGLDLLWVSLDGATPESYADVRLGAALPQIINNIENFHTLRRTNDDKKPEIGIAFVAMKRNIGELPAVLRLCTRLRASRISITNVIPYTEELCGQVLYSRVLDEISYAPSPLVPNLDLPRIDANEATREALHYIRRGGYNLSYNGDYNGKGIDRCPFIERGATAIAWDGSLSPCLPLMHDHDGFLDERLRHSRRYLIGNLSKYRLDELWELPDYQDFRRRVQEFDFSPCTICGGCDLSETNEEDCYGNTFPTCGGCLWAQSVIQCP
jgi:MoaA/NifB/PqqE/SkfB family radical SAM enzyme